MQNNKESEIRKRLHDVIEEAFVAGIAEFEFNVNLIYRGCNGKNCDRIIVVMRSNPDLLCDVCKVSIDNEDMF